MMIFDKQKFEKNAPKSILKLMPESHRNALHGKDVVFDGGGYGTVDYTVDGEEFYLYPISPDWCKEAQP